MDFLDNPSDIWKFKDIVISKIDIVEIMKECGINLESKEAGEFDFRGFCPFHAGKGGGIERTPSFFVSSSTSSFCCFGCSKTGNVIDFLSYVNGSPANITLETLAKRVGIIDNNGNYDEIKFGELKYDYEPVKTIEPFVFDISTCIRNYIKKYIDTNKFEQNFVRAEKIAEKVDMLLLKVEHTDWEYASKLCEAVKNKLGE